MDGCWTRLWPEEGRRLAELHPGGVGINQQRCGSERNAVRHATVRPVQALYPFLVGEYLRQRHQPETDHRQLEAANAIKAGNTRSRTASVSMTIPLQRAANLRTARCGFVIVVLEMQFPPAAAGAAAGVNLGIAPIQGATPASSVRYPPCRRSLLACHQG